MTLKVDVKNDPPSGADKNIGNGDIVGSSGPELIC